MSIALRQAQAPPDGERPCLDDERRGDRESESHGHAAGLEHEREDRKERSEAEKPQQQPAPSAAAFHDLLLTAAVMVGNSSAALIEAPSAGLPAVDIGSRQRGRLAAANVVHVGYGTTAIAAGVRRQLRAAATRRGRPYANPYGDGRAAERAVAAVRRWWTGPAPR